MSRYCSSFPPVAYPRTFGLRSPPRRSYTGLPLRLAQQVPERQVEAAERHDRQALPTIGNRQRIDPIPEGLNVFDGLYLGPDDQFTEVLIDDKASRFSAATVPVADDSVVRLHPDYDLPEMRLPYAHRQALPLRVDGADFGDFQWSLSCEW